MKQKIQALLVILFIAASAFLVSATEPGEADINNQADLGEYLYTSTDIATLESGNITYADLDSDMSTYRWAGLLGNVTGDIVLGDGNENTLYSWTGAGKMVYASTASSIVWTSLVDATVGDMPSYLTGGSDVDRYAATFGGSENIGSGIFTSLTSDFATTFNSTGASAWKTYSLKEGTNLVWAGLVSEDGDSFHNKAVDYQMILPENGTDGETATQAYNLWIELV